jgi:hypothetical protein
MRWIIDILDKLTDKLTYTIIPNNRVTEVEQTTNVYVESGVNDRRAAGTIDDCYV